MNITFWINTKRHKNIYCRLTKNYLRKEISTGLHIDPKQWGGTYMLAKGNSPQTRLINQRLQLIKLKIENIIFELEKKEDFTITPLVVKNMYEGVAGGQSLAFTQALQQALTIISQDITKSTHNGYDQTINSFTKFLTVNYLNDINTHAVDIPLVKRYIKYLRDLNNKFSTIKYKQSKLISLFNIIQRDIDCLKPTSNPFTTEIKKTTAEAQATTENKNKWIDISIQSILEKASSLSLKHDYARKMFLFQIHTGLSFVDILKFDPSLHVIIDIDKQKWIRLRRTKTIKFDTYSEIPFISEINTLVDYFKPFQIGSTLINNIPYVTYRQRLRAISSKLNITPVITSHMGRHTFGVRMLEASVSMESVSHMMGHASITMTESIYAKVTKRKLKIDLKEANLIR